jgi:hypothetical protein
MNFRYPRSLLDPNLLRTLQYYQLLPLIKLTTLFHITSSFSNFGESVTFQQLNFSGFFVAHAARM